jgi:hypothetical protein
MFKRLVWFSLGAGAGFGGSVYVQRRVRAVAARLTPPTVVGSVGRSARRLGGDVRDAVHEGRRAAGDRLAVARRTRPAAGDPGAAEDRSGPGGRRPPAERPTRTPVGSDADVDARRRAP